MGRAGGKAEGRAKGDGQGRCETSLLLFIGARREQEVAVFPTKLPREENVGAGCKASWAGQKRRQVVQGLELQGLDEVDRMS